ncbi:nitrogen fixation protein NifX [Rhizomicrobium electricum]|uniref:Nitrogen fixation protein NifX n=1 Tax=Rhizomicrobium electricum TaxID=480070 RepID=A0ABP3Q0N3_9PROT|nr:nitrogen fixation protein NifX [Rhizomicrobium electricum]NIJ50353.1 nitrogen fixation protein NifX [Rhizomicrobium electricum]
MRRLQVIEAKPEDTAAKALKIAFATQDLHRVDSHFGSAPAIVIYEVGPTDARFLEAVQFDQVSNQDGHHIDDTESDDRIGAKVAALTGCAMLFSLAIGGVAAARVVNAKVYPLKLPAPEAITDVIGRIQTMMTGTPPPWMRKLLYHDNATAFLDE